LRQLASDDARLLAPVVARCPKVRLEPGAWLGPEGLSRAALLVVERGTAAITTHPCRERRRMTVAIAGSGDILVPPREGEYLTALSGVVVTALTPIAYRALIARPAAAAALVERLAEAVLDRQESIAQFAAVEHVNRVREKLLQLARSHGRVATDGVHLDLPLTHDLIAQTTGSARETVTWAIAELRREGFVVREGRRYRLTVPPDTLGQAAPLAS
jgi:CRP-like cAMP-binding protein